MTPTLTSLLLLLALSPLAVRPAQAQTPAPTLAPTLAPTPTAWTCSNPEAPDTGIVHRGSRTNVCLTVGPLADWATGVEYVRYVFRPEADEYSVYKIPNSFRDLVVAPKLDFLQNNNITIFAASSTALSFLRRYYDHDKGLVYPFLTAIIDVKEGIITGIAFDDACIFCSPDKCFEDTFGFDGLPRDAAQAGFPTGGCAIPKNICEEIEATGGHQCDLQLYVVWTGTDRDGNVLSSADSRFSNFETKQIQNRFKDSLPAIPSIPSWDDINPFDDMDLNPFDRKDL